MPAPTDRKTVAVTHVDVTDIRRSRLNHTRGHIQKALDTLIYLTTPEAHFETIGQFQRPGTSGIDSHGRNPQSTLAKALLGTVPGDEVPWPRPGGVVLVTVVALRTC